VLRIISFRIRLYVIRKLKLGALALYTTLQTAFTSACFRVYKALNY
jgi:hypothetical protein